MNFMSIILLIYTENHNFEKDIFMTSMKFNKMLLNANEDDKNKKTTMFKISINNCLLMFCLSNIFKLTNESKISTSIIERWFPTTASSENFLYLGIFYVRKILSSSELNIDSELQVFNAANSWLCLDITERSIYAKNLLSKVRLTLLSIPDLKKILDKKSPFRFIDDCKNMIKAVLVNKQQLNPISCKITSRYCNQNNFNIIICGGKNFHLDEVSNNVKFFDGKNFPKLRTARFYCKAVFIKGEIYVFGGINGCNNNIVRSIEKYSNVTKTWEYIADMIDNQRHFSACSFMDNVYFMGCRVEGLYDNAISCFKFSIKSFKWKEISRMKNSRRLSACSVFEGRVVVSGGYSNDSINTVEAYDHVGNTWESMPNMIYKRGAHKSVAVKNKLFIFGG